MKKLSKLLNADIGDYTDTIQTLNGTKNPFSLDSKEPKSSFRDFLMGEVRYASLAKAFPEQAEALFEKTEKDAMDRLAGYKKLAEQE